jgi:hypothetical protein
MAGLGLISRGSRPRETERREDHEEEEPITENIFQYAHCSSTPPPSLSDRAVSSAPAVLMTEISVFLRRQTVGQAYISKSVKSSRPI